MNGWASRTALVFLLLLALVPAALAAEAEPKPQGPWLKTKYGVTLYGYFKLDVAYDDSRMNQGNYARWVEPETQSGDDNQSNITANQTRFGLKFDTEERHPVRTRGQVEADFYGAGPAENKPELLLRHAFLELEWPEKEIRLLAGQTSDVMSPLNPPVLNYTVNWWCGNIGYRRPQVRFTKGFKGAKDAKYTLDLALARNIGHDGPFDPGDTGEDEGVPALQGRFAFAVPLGKEWTGSFGFSGHEGGEEWDLDATGNNVELDSSSIGFDFSIKQGDKLGFTGEIFDGKNLDSYLGGIGNGIVVPAAGGAPTEISSTGGWVNIGFVPRKKTTVNFGAGADAPDQEDLPQGYRSRNNDIWGNVLYDLTPATRLGLELSYWETSYKGQDKANDMRMQGSFIFNF
jgi:hypothetical protein